MNINFRKNIYPLISLVFASALLVLGFFYYKDFNRLGFLTSELDNAKADLSDLQSRYENLLEERDYIYDNLLSEQAKNELFENQIKDIVGTVGRLDELSKTDKELLQKYSKVYFLNEHYVPDSLTDISPDYVYEKARKLQMHARAYPYFQKMIEDAKKQNIDLFVVSAFRSFGEQSALKNGYLVKYGSGANQFSADQGYSEHQLGTALDLTTKDLGANFTSFGGTDAYEWLLENAHKYGFALSYPEDNTYYQFEPWHWRFVGKALALRLHEEGEHFYDLPQNKIDAYLINIFD